MILAFLLAAMIFAALLPVLWPLLRGTVASAVASGHNQAVYRDQLRELDRDAERGLLPDAESAAARLEVQRRLLAAASAERADAAPSRSGPSHLVAAFIAVGATGGALAIYLLLGMPDTPKTPGGEELARLAEQLRTNPGDAENWARYARVMSQLTRWDDAEIAWRKALSFGGKSPSAVAALGEVLVVRAGGAVSEEALGLFDMALRGDPDNDMARYYQALAMFQNGDPRGALSRWGDLLAAMPPNSPARPDVIRRIEEAARAAGVPVPPVMSRAAMIEADVAKLTARLAAEPNDPEGWTRLGRSHALLGHGADAAAAYEKAAALRPADPLLKLAAAEAMLMGVKPEDGIPARALTLLRDVETTLPDEPAVLWYLGLDAARLRHPDQARDYWTRLSRILPPGSDDLKMVLAALGALTKPR